MTGRNILFVRRRAGGERLYDAAGAVYGRDVLVGGIKRRWMMIVAAVAIATAGLALPAAADINLTAGDWAEVAYTAGDGVNVREAPSSSAAAVAGLPEGFALTIEDGPVVGDDGLYWYAVWAELEDGGVYGWVSADYLSGSWSDWEVGVDGPNVDASAASGVPAYVSTGGEWLNMRYEPASWSEAFYSIPDGAWVDVLAPATVDDEGTAWSLVSYDGVVGYSIAAYLTGFPTGSSGLDEGLLIVSGTGGDGLSLREWPDPDGALVTVLSEGTNVWWIDGPVTDWMGDTWYQIEADGLIGWAHGDYLASVGRGMAWNGGSWAGEAIIEAAMAYIGVPYVWGGTTPDGFDCSGFTWYIVSTVVDSNYPRPNEDQFVYGVEIAADSLAPGDLVFFQNTYQWGLSHVGFYLGDGLFISASGEHSGVGISSLSDPYWATRYVTARRVT